MFTGQVKGKKGKLSLSGEKKESKFGVGAKTAVVGGIAGIGLLALAILSIIIALWWSQR
mgnify:CR=1 FL=1